MGCHKNTDESREMPFNSDIHNEPINEYINEATWQMNGVKMADDEGYSADLCVILQPF